MKRLIVFNLRKGKLYWKYCLTCYLSNTCSIIAILDWTVFLNDWCLHHLEALIKLYSSQLTYVYLFYLSIYLIYVIFAFVYWYYYLLLLLLLLPLLLNHLFDSACCSCSGSSIYSVPLSLIISTLLFMLPVFINTLLFIR